MEGIDSEKEERGMRGVEQLHRGASTLRRKGGDA